MWRVALFISLVCSLSLNVYLFLQLNVYVLEKKIQQDPHVRIQSKPYVAQIKKNFLNPSQANTHAKINSGDISDIHNVKPIRAQHRAGKIKKAIQSKEYITASFLMKNFIIDDTGNIDEIAFAAELSALRLFWLQTSQGLIEHTLFTDAENSISAYLEFERDDVDFLYLQVDLYKQQHLSLLAIKQAYEVQYHVFNEVKKGNVIEFARDLVQQQAEVLINKGLWFELRELVEEVLLLDPDNLNLQWLIGRAQYQLGDFEYALNAIEPLLNHANYKIKAQSLLAKIESALRKPESIPLSRQGEHYIVQALINDRFTLSLLLDTGASISLISERAFSALNRYAETTYIKDIQLGTAGGQITASLYQVSEFAIQGYVVNDFVFAVSPFVSKHNDGLLGMNFLRNFDFYIDQNNNSLMLKNK
ncbi:MAG: retropepsin-like aspartic protease [Colwellia sp.]